MEPITFLIVDDSAAIRKILQRILHQTELPVADIFEASNGHEALTMLAAHRIGAVLSDVNMPNMDGMELLRRLRELPDYHSVPVIMVTTEGGEAKVKEAAQLGATAYVRKPFTPDQLRDKLTTLLAN